MKACYGNIGCGRSWIEVDGKAIDQDDVNDARANENRRRAFIDECLQEMQRAR